MNLTPKLQQFICSYLRAVDQMVIGRIEQIEGRVPSDTELARYGHCIKQQGHPDQWTWRGELIATAEMDIAAGRYRIKPIYASPAS